MLCPNEVKLSAFADGELAPQERREVEEHIAHCQRCAQAVERDGRLVAALRGHWHILGDAEPAAGCLSDEELAAFVDGSLPAVKRPYAERHLAECDRCIAGVADLFRALRAVGALPAGEPARTADARPRAAFPSRLRDLSLALSGAAAVLIVLAGGYFFTYGRAKHAMPAEMAMRAAPHALEGQVPASPAPELSRRAAPLRSEEAERAFDATATAPPDHEAPRHLEPRAELGEATQAAGRERDGKASMEDRLAVPRAMADRVDGVVGAEGAGVAEAKRQKRAAPAEMPAPAVALEATPTPPPSAMAASGLSAARGGAGAARAAGPPGERGAQSPAGRVAETTADHLAPAAAEPSVVGAPAGAPQAPAVRSAAGAPEVARRGRPSPPENLTKAAKDAPDDPQPQLALAMWYLQNGYLVEGRARVAVAQQLLAKERAGAARPAAGKPGGH